MIANVYVLSLVEVSPNRKSQLAKADPDVKGAFVNCLASATSPEEAIEIVRAALKDDGYEMKSVEQVCEFSSYRTKGRLSKDMISGAERIRLDGGVWYSHFSCYYSEKGDSQHSHEIKFVNSFVIEEKRSRWIESLSNLRKRDRFLTVLADESDFRTDCMTKIPANIETPKKICEFLENFCSVDACWIISQWNRIDGKQLPLALALSECRGIGLGTVLSLLPGRLCYYEGEMPGNRWLLKS